MWADNLLMIMTEKWQKETQVNSPLSTLMLRRVIYRVLQPWWAILAPCSWFKEDSFVQSTTGMHGDIRNSSMLVWYYILDNSAGKIWDGLSNTDLGSLIACCISLLVYSPTGRGFLTFSLCDITLWYYRQGNRRVINHKKTTNAKNLQ